jgi:hypothetical protein
MRLFGGAAARRDKRQTAANEIATVFHQEYEKLRDLLQARVRSGQLRAFSEHDWLIGGAEPEAGAPDVLRFRDSRRAFEYASAYTNSGLSEGKVLIGLIEAAERAAQGLQSCRIRLAGAAGGVVVPFCMTIDNRVAELRAGDLTAFLLVSLNEVPKSHIFAHIGFVVAKLEPALSATRGWKVSRMLRV